MGIQVTKRAGAGLAGALLGALALVQPISPAGASSLKVDPVRVEISAKRKIASVKISNADTASVTVRIYAMLWTQEGGADVFRESSAIIVSPPVTTIKAGATQLVRVGMRGALAPGFYRVIVEEVPQAHPEAGIRVSLRLNLPLLVLQEAGPLADLSWSARQQANKSWVVEAANRGTNYVRIEPGDADRATGLKLESRAPVGVVLPRSSRHWVLDGAPVVTDAALFGRLTAAANTGPAHFASR
jgi:fimbrial chaperone protein